MAHTEPTILLKPAFCAVLNIYAEEFNRALANPHQFNSAAKYKKALRYECQDILTVLHGQVPHHYEPALIDVAVKWAEEAGYVWQDEDEEVDA